MWRDGTGCDVVWAYDFWSSRCCTFVTHGRGRNTFWSEMPVTQSCTKTRTGAITALRRWPARNYRVQSGYAAAAYAQCEAQLCSLCNSGHKHKKSLCLLWQKSGNARHSGAHGLLAFTPTCQCSGNCSTHTHTHHPGVYSSHISCVQVKTKLFYPFPEPNTTPNHHYLVHYVVSCALFCPHLAILQTCPLLMVCILCWDTSTGHGLKKDRQFRWTTE